MRFIQQIILLSRKNNSGISRPIWALAILYVCILTLRRNLGQLFKRFYRKVLIWNLARAYAFLFITLHNLSDRAKQFATPIVFGMLHTVQILQPKVNYSRVLSYVIALTLAMPFFPSPTHISAEAYALETASLIAQYDFAGNLADSLGGSTCTEYNTDESWFGTNTEAGSDQTYWRWIQDSAPGGGLIIDLNQNISESYSIGVRFSYDDIDSGYNKIIDYKNKGNDTGFYFYSGGKLNFYPHSSLGQTTTSANDIVDIVATRDGSSDVFTAYIIKNGTLVKEVGVTDSNKQAVPSLVDGKPRFGFFFDDTATNGEFAPGGKVYSIKIWNGPITQAVAAQAMNASVTYNGNGNTGGTLPASSTTYTSGTEVTVLDNTGELTKTGYSFSGWNTQSDGQGTTYAAESTLTMPASNVILYAIWNLATETPPSDTPSDTPSDPSPAVAPSVSRPTIQNLVKMDGVSFRPGTVKVTYPEGKRTGVIDASSAVKTKVKQLIDLSPPETDATPETTDFTIDVTRLKASKVEVKLTGDVVMDMGQKELSLTVINNDVRSFLPTSDIDVKGIAERMGVEDQIDKVEFSVIMDSPTEQITTQLREMADQSGYELVLDPMSLEIQATNLRTREKINVERFSGYTGRLFEIPQGVDPNKITTGIVMNEDGTVSHVPTVITEINGVYYAKINSLTNSTYSVIWNPRTNQDMEGHWAEASANNMVSRLVIDKDTNGNFNPELTITRGEFVTTLAKALGLYHAKEGVERFGDMEKENPYYEVVGISSDYGLLSGYPDGNFQPDQILNRQEMMVILAKAAALLKLEAINEKTVKDFLDSAQVSLWAEPYIDQNIQYGLIQGHNGMLGPRDAVTKAEVAVALETLMKLAGLIN